MYREIGGAWVKISMGDIFDVEEDDSLQVIENSLHLICLYK